MISLARLAAQKAYNYVGSKPSKLSVEELDKITMHIHKSTKPSPDVVNYLFKASIASILHEPHCICWDRSSEKRAKTFIFANTEINYTNLLDLTSTNALQLPSRDNQFVFLSPRIDPNSDESVKGLMTLLIWRFLFPQSICIIRSQPFRTPDQAEDAAANEISSEFFELKNVLPTSLLLDNAIFIAHGGVSQHTSQMTLEDIKKLSRYRLDHRDMINELTLAGMLCPIY